MAWPQTIELPPKGYLKNYSTVSGVSGVSDKDSHVTVVHKSKSDILGRQRTSPDWLTRQDSAKARCAAFLTLRAARNIIFLNVVYAVQGNCGVHGLIQVDIRSVLDLPANLPHAEPHLQYQRGLCHASVRVLYNNWPLDLSMKLNHGCYGRSGHQHTEVCTQPHFRVEVFYTSISMEVQAPSKRIIKSSPIIGLQRKDQPAHPAGRSISWLTVSVP